MRYDKLVCAAVGMVSLLCCGFVHAEQMRLELGTVPNARFRELAERRTITFSALPAVAAPSGEQLINGVPADPTYFPTLFRMTTGGTCTAALVGEAALLTAAHCVANRALIKFVVGTREVQGICEQARGYHPQLNKSEDWALCLLEFPALGIAYESVNTTMPAVGTRVMLSGYGCTQQGGSIDGVLRVGISNTVNGQSSGFPAETSTIFTKSSIDLGGAILCPGDSGGPLFVVSGNSFNDARKLVGVNSRTTYHYGYSLFAATGSPAGRQFFEDWSARHGQKICGVNTNDNCR